MNITVWNDTQIFGEETVIKNNHAKFDKGNLLLQLHRRRQLELYEKCMQKFKSDGHQWVILLDTDEFMVVRANHNEDIRLPGTVLKYLKEEANNATSCLPLPRRRYGTKESPQKFINKHVPKGFNSSDFLTLRWRRYGMPGRTDLIKSMIDVSRVEWDDLRTNAEKKNSAHAPLEICGDPIRMGPSESKLIVSHYAGTWEQFSFREDAREGTIAESMIGQEAYHKLKRFRVYIDDLHREWLVGFSQSMGKNEALRLLKDVGKVKGWK